jgi:hypothetical protein
MGNFWFMPFLDSMGEMMDKTVETDRIKRKNKKTQKHI